MARPPVSQAAKENLQVFGSEQSAFSQICGLAAMILPAL
jgi:hypothetical protein